MEYITRLQDALSVYSSRRKTMPLDKYDSCLISVDLKIEALEKELVILQAQMSKNMEDSRKLLQACNERRLIGLLGQASIRYLISSEEIECEPIITGSVCTYTINYPLDTSKLVWGEDKADGLVYPQEPSGIFIKGVDTKEVYKVIKSFRPEGINVHEIYASHKWIYAVHDEVLISLNKETKTGNILIGVISLCGDKRSTELDYVI